ncbi:hypothetical protein, partial [Micromonospora fulviviridis]
RSRGVNTFMIMDVRARLVSGAARLTYLRGLLRHTFAVNVLIGWYSAGVDVSARLPVLSAFLGHSSPEATYWYLQATPQLLALAAQRLDAAVHQDTPPERGEVTGP